MGKVQSSPCPLQTWPTPIIQYLMEPLPLPHPSTLSFLRLGVRGQSLNCFNTHLPTHFWDFGKAWEKCSHSTLLRACPSGREEMNRVCVFPFKRPPSVKHPHSLRLCFKTIQNYYSHLYKYYPLVWIEHLSSAFHSNPFWKCLYFVGKAPCMLGFKGGKLRQEKWEKWPQEDPAP